MKLTTNLVVKNTLTSNIDNQRKERTMLGESIIRTLTYAAITIALLILAGEILSSAIWIALALKSGSILPVLTITTAAIVFSRFTAKSLREPDETRILSISAWILTGYLALVMGLFVVAYGFAASFVVAFLVGLIMYMVREPPELSILLTEQYRNARNLLEVASAGNSLEKWGQRATRNLAAFRLPKESIEDAVGIIRDNPELGLSLTHYEDLLVLYVPKIHKNRIHSLINDSGIQVQQLSKLSFLGCIYVIPAALEEYGHKLTDYRIIRDEDILEQLLKSLPIDSTLYSHPEGPILVLRFSDAGMVKTEQIPSGFEARIIVGRDISALAKGRRGVIL